MSTAAHFVTAELLKLTLVARKANPRCRWAAMTNGRWSTRTCTGRTYASDTLVAQPPLLSPMQRGRLHAAVQRQRLTQGLPSIRRTFGVGLRALLAEPAHILPAEASR